MINNQINNKFTNNCEYLLFHAYIEKHVMEKLKNLTSKKYINKIYNLARFFLLHKNSLTFYFI